MGASTSTYADMKMLYMREICPMVVADEENWCAMEAADGSKEEGIVVMPTAIPDPPKTGGVDSATRTGKGKPP